MRTSSVVRHRSFYVPAQDTRADLIISEQPTAQVGGASAALIAKPVPAIRTALMRQMAPWRCIATLDTRLRRLSAGLLGALAALGALGG